MSEKHIFCWTKKILFHNSFCEELFAKFSILVADWITNPCAEIPASRFYIERNDVAYLIIETKLYL